MMKTTTPTTTTPFLFLTIALLWRDAFSAAISGTNTYIVPNLTTRAISPRVLAGTFNAVTDNSCFTAFLLWSATQNASDLTSTITVRFYIEKTTAYSSRVYSSDSLPYTIAIGETTTSGTTNFDFPAGCAVGTRVTLGTATETVTHNADGTKKILLSGTFESGTSIGTATVGGTASLTAIPVSVKVTYSGNGGTASIISKTVTYGSKYGALATATRTGYTFKGWYTSATGGSEVTSDTIVTTTSAHTIYAHWSINSYTITFNTNGGSSCRFINQNYGTAVTLPTTAKTGYTFNYWCSDSALTAKYTSTTMPDKSFTLYAKFTINNYTLRFIFGNGEDDVLRTMSYNETIEYPDDPEREGYTFDEWDYNITNMPDYNLSVTALWIPDKYTVSFDVNGGDELSVTSTTVSFNSAYGDLPTPTRNEHAFMGWFTDANETVTSGTIMNTASNHTLHAHWEKVSSQVEIVFSTRNLTEGDVENIVKKYVGEDTEFTIVGFEEESGEVKTIIKFTNAEDAVEFVRKINSSSGEAIRRVNFVINDESFSTLFYPALFFVVILI